jgi:hypothetical protein
VIIGSVRVAIYDAINGFIAVTFGDVGWNGYGCFTHLGGEALELLGREILGGSVDLFNEVHGVLPDFEFAIA